MKTLLTSGHEERAQDLLNVMSTRKAEDSDLSQLAVTLQTLVNDNKADVVFGMMFSTVQQTHAFNVLLENMDKAIDYARKEKQMLSLSGLLLHKGIAFYHYDHNEERKLESALNLWEQCSSLIYKGSSWELQSIQSEAIRHISLHHFHQATSSSTRNVKTHIQKLEEWTAHPRVFYRIKSYLGCYYAGQGDPARAKQVLLEDMKLALALLSDEWEDNDSFGYYYLANTLMYSGDYLNALSAWSLLGPTNLDSETILLDFKDEHSRSMALELNKIIQSRYSSDAPLAKRVRALLREAELQESKLSAKDEANKTDIEAWQEIQHSLTKSLEQVDEDSSEILPHSNIERERTGNLNISCDGLCNKAWAFASNFYCCKFCPDLWFCQNCWE